MSEKELEFAVFCIENVASSLEIDGAQIYNLWLKSGFLTDVVVGLYDVLHTQGKEYVVSELLGQMKARGLV